MAGPGGREVGRVSIRVLPDTSAFGRSLERYLNRVERTLHVDIGVGLQDGDVAASELTLDELTRDRTVNVGVDIDRQMIDRFEGVLGGVSGATGGIGGLGGLSGGSTKILAILAAVVALLPVISTAILALPGIVAAILTPIAAILVGLDGIKKAASVLAEPFERLTTVVSGVFEKGLTPVFKQLRRIFRPLERGLSLVAESIVGIFAAVTDGLTSTDSLETFGNIFARLARAMDIIAPSLTPLTEAFLTLTEAGAQAFEEMAPALADLTVAFAQFVDWAADTGLLAESFKFLAAVILTTLTVFAGLVALGTLSAAAVSAAVGAFKRLPGLIGGFVTQAANYVKALPERVVSALSSLASKLFNSSSAGMQSFLLGIVRGTAAPLAYIRQIPGKILRALGGLGSLLFGAGVALVQGFINGIASKIGELIDQITKLKNLASGDTPGKHAYTPPDQGGGDSNQDVPRISASQGRTFLSDNDFGTSDPTPTRTILKVGEREFVAYMEEVSDSRVDSAASLRGETDRAL